MQFLDAKAGAGREEEEAHTHEGAPSWDGEPPSRLSRSDPEALFSRLEGDLAEADVVRVLGREWLVAGEFRHRLEALLSAFRTGGGRVRYLDQGSE